MVNMKNPWSLILGILFLIAIVLRIIYYVYSLGYGEKIITIREISNYIVWAIIILFVISQQSNKIKKD
ncbi:MAG: hypothetical protein CFE23_16010 [Flavobacterium sp. BFFFF1]|nr:MAG: hypothetical protein CFE23_16010 [Flavobacterium sp. BFFFF1]